MSDAVLRDAARLLRAGIAPDVLVQALDHAGLDALEVALERRRAQLAHDRLAEAHRTGRLLAWQRRYGEKPRHLVNVFSSSLQGLRPDEFTDMGLAQLARGICGVVLHEPQVAVWGPRPPMGKHGEWSVKTFDLTCRSCVRIRGQRDENIAGVTPRTRAEAIAERLEADRG